MTESKMERLLLKYPDPKLRTRGQARPLTEEDRAILSLEPGEMLKFTPCYGEHKHNTKRMWCTAQSAVQQLRHKSRQHRALPGIKTWHDQGNFFVGILPPPYSEEEVEEEVAHEIDRLIDGDYDEDTLNLLYEQLERQVGGGS